jgi:hypothetical protein
MSSFKFNSCLSCLSCFNFFSKCFKPNRSENSKELMPLLDNENNGDSSQHGSDTKFRGELTPAPPPNNSPEQSFRNDSSRNASPTLLYTLVEVYIPENESEKHNYTSHSEVSPVSSDSFELSPSIMPQISLEFSPGAVEISQSPELRFSRSHSPEIDPKFIFITSPGQISREKDSDELSQNKTQSMFAEIVRCSDFREEILPPLFQEGLSSMPEYPPEDQPSKPSSDPKTSSIYQRVSTLIERNLLDPLERKPSENRLRPGIKGGSTIAKCATMVPTSKAVEVAMRIAEQNGRRVCNF